MILSIPRQLEAAENLPGSIFLKYCRKKNAVCSLIKLNAEKHICLKTAEIYVM